MTELSKIIEWEYIDLDEEITKVNLEKEKYELRSDVVIKVSRDLQFNLNPIITGFAEPDDLKRKESLRKGEFVKPEILKASSKSGEYNYQFNGIAIGKRNFKYLTTSGDIPFTAELIVNSIEKKSATNTEEAECHCDWFISGDAQIVFPRSTTRYRGEKYKRVREESYDPKEEPDDIRMLSGSSRDYFLIDTQEFSFMVSEVPKEHGPEWAYKYCIEYRKAYGRIPSLEEREGIAEIVGFILGGQLNYVGSSSYSGNNSLLHQEYHNPWGDNVIELCQKSNKPPMYVQGMSRGWKIVESVLNGLVDPYLKFREIYALKHVLGKYWVARHAAIGINLPILSSALEALAEKVLKHHPEKEQHHMEYKHFNALIADELKSIEKKLISCPGKDKILNKIKTASLRGANEKIIMLFEQIKLPVGNLEMKAIKSRNRMAHATVGDAEQEELEEIISLGHAYETLFNRVLLKILGYSGTYIDYYNLDFPERSIDEPIPDTRF